MGKEPILSGDRVLGYVTSAGYGYTVGQSISTAICRSAMPSRGMKVEVQYFGRRYSATVAKDPLYDPEGARLRD